MKKLLIFDAYGTLISSGTSSIDSTKKILSLQDKEIDPVLFYADWKQIHRKHFDECNEKQFITEWEIYRQNLKVLYEKYDIIRPYQEDVKIMLAAQYNRKVFDDVMDTIFILKKDFRVVIGSTSDTQPLLKNLKDNHLDIDQVYTSERIQKYKPSKDFYKYILNKEKVKAEETIFIGDSLIDDIQGPSLLYMSTILIDRFYNYKEGKIKPDYVIHHLNEILDIVKVI